MLQLTLATRNRHKTREFAEILGREFALSDLANRPDVPEAEETGKTFEENAIIKALGAWGFVSGLVVADDSGLEVDALTGNPGVRSARYAGEGATDQENVTKLLRELDHARASEEQRGARFVCAIALVRDGELLQTFRGVVEGRITHAPAGAGGFGYDPIFAPAGHERTFAELGDTVKNQISHRAMAIKQLRQYLEQLRPPACG